MIPVAIVVATLLFAALCVASDLRSRSIPNLLSGLGMVTGIVANAAHFGMDGLTASLAGLAAAIALLLAPFALGGLGGGDVKMMGAIGALLGPRLTLEALLAGMVFGGIVMALHLVRVGRLRATLQTVEAMAATSVLTRSLDPLRVSAARPGAITLPYSVPLALGTVAALALSGNVLL